MLKEQIYNAIQERQVIRFTYDGDVRMVEPFLLGQTTAGNDALRAWQVGGYSESESQPPWRLYRLDRMTNLQITGDSFEGIRPDYNPGDRDMTHVYIHV